MRVHRFAPLRFLERFIHGEAAGGVVLMIAAALGLAVANSPWAPAYFGLLARHVGRLSLLHWINDGLMAIFFLLVGLEVKREWLVGQLASAGDRLLPGVAALAGMIAPAAVFVLLNLGEPVNLRGWAIPAATDIAFALGLLALLGSRAPPALKILLTAIAVIDDLLAVLIIAIFYTGALSIWPLMLAGLGVLMLVLLNRAGVRGLWPYGLLGCGIWYCVLLSGVHATLAGVAVALAIPLRTGDGDAAPLMRLERAIHPWTALLIVPLFGFANAGVSFAGFAPGDALSPLPLGVALGLLLGKQAGIFSAIRLLVGLRIASLPSGTNWRDIYGMALLCGIGFTMSLFIGALAFPGDPHRVAALKIGVFGGSILSGLAGCGVIAWRRGRQGN